MDTIPWSQIKQLDNPLIVDVRSPSEYHEDHVPDAVNLPVLDDKEHEEVGTIYHNDSPFKARQVGARRVCEQLPEHLRWFENHHDPDRPILIACWRGGTRSYSLGVVLDAIGYEVYRLEGGYKSYRKRVAENLRSSYPDKPFLTVFGYTGAGKTRLLDRLATQGTPVLDLEGAANHRGSAFGGVGQPTQPSQKRFESRLFQTIRKEEFPYVTEGESRFVGQREIPPDTFEAIVNAPRVWLEADRSTRVQRIVQDYEWPQAQQALSEQVSDLTERLGKERVHQLQDLLASGEVKLVVDQLLQEYYDPAYDRSGPSPEDCDYRVNGEDLEKSSEEVQSIRQALVRN